MWAVLTLCQYGTRTDTVSVSVYTTFRFQRKGPSLVEKTIVAVLPNDKSNYYFFLVKTMYVCNGLSFSLVTFMPEAFLLGIIQAK